MGLPTTSEKILEEETRLDCEIPEIIKSIILKNNGGAECYAGDERDEFWILFSVKDTRTRKHASRSANYIERETESAKTWANFPDEAVALGENGSGDYLITFKKSACIYIWRHESGEISETSIKITG